MEENETPITDQSAADIMARLQQANPALMEETIAKLPADKRQVADEAIREGRRRS